MTPTAAEGHGHCTKCGAGPHWLTWGRCPACWQAVVEKRGDRMSAGPTALYRLFNEYRDRLYIGTTVDLQDRWKNHRKRMPWWYQVDHERTQIEWLDCGSSEAKQQEQAAILAELPWYNRTFGRDEDGNRLWPNLPPGCPPPPEYCHTPVAEYRLVWRVWFVEFRDCMLNPEERAALGRLP